MKVDSEIVEKLVSNLRKNIDGTFNFPLYNSHCYFCLLHDDVCSDCEYVEKHGRCGNAGSVWKKIINLKDGLEYRNSIKRNRADKIIRVTTKLMLEAKTVNELMIIKRDMLASLSYCYYNDDEYLQRFVGTIKNEYWQGITGENDDFIAFGDMLKIGKCDGGYYDTILARASDDLAVVICLENGNRWSDAKECELKYVNNSWGMTIAELECKLIRNQRDYIIERRNNGKV